MSIGAPHHLRPSDKSTNSSRMRHRSSTNSRDGHSSTHDTREGKNRFWRIKSPEQDFEFLYWTINLNKMLFWNLFTCKGTETIDWVGRFRPSPRLHIGDVLWNSALVKRREFSQCSWSALLVLKSAKTTHPKGRAHLLMRWGGLSKSWLHWPVGQCLLPFFF